MDSKQHNAEWVLLQNQYDSYEKHSLFIKLLSIVLFMFGVISEIFPFYTFFILAVLWLQDAIWKTFQSRIEVRLLKVEQSIKENSKESAFQFNSDFLQDRLSGFSLLNEYFRQAIRPTIAFPYCALIMVLLVKSVI